MGRELGSCGYGGAWEGLQARKRLILPPGVAGGVRRGPNGWSGVKEVQTASFRGYPGLITVAENLADANSLQIPRCLGIQMRQAQQ